MNEVGYVLSLFLGVFLAMTGYQYITQKESPSQQSLTSCSLTIIVLSVTHCSIIPSFHHSILLLKDFQDLVSGKGLKFLDLLPISC